MSIKRGSLFSEPVYNETGSETAFHPKKIWEGVQIYLSGNGVLTYYIKRTAIKQKMILLKRKKSMGVRYTVENTKRAFMYETN